MVIVIGIMGIARSVVYRSRLFPKGKQR
nr:hypothetical protein [Vibrio neptunius]